MTDSLGHNPVGSQIQGGPKIWENSRREKFLLVVVASFVFVNTVALGLARENAIRWQHFRTPAAWLALMLGAQYILQRFRPSHDPYLLPVVALLSGWGLLVINRLAPNFLGRQVLWLSIGTGAMVFLAVGPRSLRLLRQYRYTWLTGGLVLLALTLLFGVNPSGAGAALWLRVPLLGRVFFQPSELLKLLLVVFLASYFAEQAQWYRFDSDVGRNVHWPYLAPLLLMWGFCVVLLVWQRDLGAATLFFIVFLAMLYLATGLRRYVIGGLLLLLLAGAIGYFAFGVVRLRVDTWWNPWPEASGRGFQIVQSLYAIASGGIAGQGIAQGSPDFIPVVHTDFVYSAIAEEWGLLGGLTILGSFSLLTLRGFRIAGTTSSAFRMFLAAGITLVIGAQALLIMSGVTKLLPLTGVTLPFVSYGGSSLLISAVMIGFMLNLSSVTPWD